MKNTGKKRIAAAAVAVAAMVLGACSPSGNLASTEHENAAKTLTATPAPTTTPTPSPRPTLVPTAAPSPIPTAGPTPIPAVVVTPVPGQENAYCPVTVVNVRAEASADSELLGQIDPGTKLIVKDVVDESWAEIEFEGQKGYVSVRFLVKEADYVPSSDDEDRNYDSDSENRYEGNDTAEETGDNGAASENNNGSSDNGSEEGGNNEENGGGEEQASEGGEDEGGNDDGGNEGEGEGYWDEIG